MFGTYETHEEYTHGVTYSFSLIYIFHFLRFEYFFKTNEKECDEKFRKNNNYSES